MVRVIVKTSLGKKFETDVGAHVVVIEWKRMIAEEAGVPASAQRLLYRGRVLKDEEEVLENYGIEDGGTVHLLRGTAPAEESSIIERSSALNTAVSSGSGGVGGPQASQEQMLSPFGSFFGGSQQEMQQRLMRDPDALSAAMNSPMTRALMENPEYMRRIMESNPQLRGVLENNPQLRHALNDPNLMREAMEVARSPARLREAMRHQDLAISNVESHPEGFNALRRMYEDVQAPLYDGMDASSMGNGVGQQQATPRRPLAPNAPAGALPNPWAPPSSTIPGAPTLPQQQFPPQLFSGLGLPNNTDLTSLFGNGLLPSPGAAMPPPNFRTASHQTPNTAPPPAPVRPNPWASITTPAPPAADEALIDQLIDLGFADRAANARALAASDGDLQEAIDRLLEDDS